MLFLQLVSAMVFLCSTRCVVQGVAISAMVPTGFLFAVVLVFVHVSVSIMDLCSWFELVECMCEVGIGADEGCECKCHDKVEARLMLRPQRA